MHVGKYFILVKISKKAQAERKEKMGNIYIHPSWTFMLYNLQYGEIVQIGARPARFFPEMSIGDTAMFHHAVEGSDKESGCLLYSDADFNYYTVNVIPQEEDKLFNNRFWGIIKNGKVIPFGKYLFLDNDISSVEKQVTSALIHTIGNTVINDESFYERKQAELKTRREGLEKSAAGKLRRHDYLGAEEIYSVINNIEQQRKAISQEVNKAKIIRATVMAVNDKTSIMYDISAGDNVLIKSPKLLYPLNIYGKSFFLLRSIDFLEGKIC